MQIGLLTANPNRRVPPGVHKSAAAAHRGAVRFGDSAAVDISLILASERGDLAEVKRLVALNHDVNTVGPKDLTALQTAVANKHAEVVRFLVGVKGIRVNPQSANAPWPLMLAIAMESPELVKALLLHPGIELNRRNHTGSTPLTLAIRLGQVDIVKALLQHPNIDLKYRDNRGKTAWDYAQLDPNKTMMTLLRKRNRVSTRIGLFFKRMFS